MENWGLITYRESILFHDSLISSYLEKQFTTIVIAHELSHQWFGNLVTMKYWNDLWLNEGFASFVEYFGTDYVEKDFKMVKKIFGLKYFH
jgi:aminopeptidase N